MKVVLNPKHFRIRAKAEDGTLWLTHEKYLRAVVPVKDVTNEVLLSLCADLSAADTETGAVKIERSVKFSDGMICKITVEMESNPYGANA